MTTATCPFSIELSSLTMRIRQEQSTSRERASRIRPTAISDRFTSTKRCVPGNTQKHAHNYSTRKKYTIWTKLLAYMS